MNCPHPQPFSPGEKGARVLVPSPWGEGEGEGGKGLKQENHISIQQRRRDLMLKQRKIWIALAAGTGLSALLIGTFLPIEKLKDASQQATGLGSPTQSESVGSPSTIVSPSHCSIAQSKSCHPQSNGSEVHRFARTQSGPIFVGQRSDRPGARRKSNRIAQRFRERLLCSLSARCWSNALKLMK